MCVCVCVLCLELQLQLSALSWQGSVQLGDLAVDERTQSLFQFIVVPLQLSLVLSLVRTNQGFILLQGIFTPARKIAQEVGIFEICRFCLKSNLCRRCGVCRHLLVKSLKQSRSLL